MKKILILLTLFSLALAATGQNLPKPGDVRKDYRADYRDALRDYEKSSNRLDKAGWDFYLDKIEAVPTDVLSAEQARAMGYTNWYADQAAPNSLASRMVAAAKRNGIGLITDTACDTDHPELQKGKVVGRSYMYGECKTDVHGHGTHVTGIFYRVLKPLIDAGKIEYSQRQYLGDQGQGSFNAIINGVVSDTKWVEDNYLSKGKFAVANASWGGNASIYEPLNTELKKSEAAGIAWFFAAGNNNGPVIFPGNSPYTHATAALDRTLKKASYSCYGKEVEFTAGGSDIYSTYPGGLYASLSGTSMASPATSALAAAAMCFYPELDAQTVAPYLARVAQDVGEPGKDDLYGWGMLMMQAILDTAPGGTPPPDPDPDPEPEPTPFPKRTITFEVPGSFVMLWDVYVPGQDKKRAPEDAAFARELGAYQFGVTGGGVDFLTVDEPSAASLKRLTVTGLTVEVETVQDAAVTSKILRELTERYFTSRAVYMGPPTDFYSATYWTAYFYDLILTRQYKGPPSLKVVAITGTDEAGNAVRLEGDELKDIQ